MPQHTLTISFPAGLVVLASVLLLLSSFRELRAIPFLQTAATAHAEAQTGSHCPVEKPDHATGRQQYRYHKELPNGPLPPTLDPEELMKILTTPDSEHAAFVVYGIAARIKEILYQVPCYCGCDESKGHESLYDCFTGSHGVGCGTCQMEAIYVFEQRKKGKQAAEIRAAMEGGGWNANVSEYVEKHYRQYAPGTGKSGANKPLAKSDIHCGSDKKAFNPQGLNSSNKRGTVHDIHQTGDRYITERRQGDSGQL
jgi:hypothetical protein